MLHLLFCIVFWGIVFSFIFQRIILGINQGVSYLKHLHQIPCAKCAYFTGDYRLKCPLNPAIALSENAINCCDFQASSHSNFNNQQSCNNQTFSKI